MMLPSWFTRLRDLKAGFNYKEQNKLHAPSPPAKLRRDEDSASFAKSWSLQRANSKAKSARMEADVTTPCDDSCPSSSNELSPLGGVENVCNLPDSELTKDATALLMHACANLDPWDGDFISMSSCKRVSSSLSFKEIKAVVLKGHGVSDNDTEDFALTSETRSSFCSETSSADSSVSCKSGCEEKGNQDERNWQEGDVCIKISGLVSKDLQDNCVVEEQNGSCHAEITSELVTTSCPKSVQMARDIWRGRGSFLFSYLTLGKHKSVGSNAEARNILDKNNASRDSLKTGDACSLVENHDNLVKENVGKISSKSSERDKEKCAVPSIKHNKSNAVTLDNSFEKRNTAAEANVNLVFDHGDTYRCTSNSLESYSVDPPAQNVWLEKRTQPHSTGENRSATASSTRCALPEMAEENKGRVFSMRRRRQRGASISAVLPPDLQGVVGDSLALVKMSDDPYEDFRQSIYEMIMEKDLEGSMDVEELLYCYLTLNAPEHHELIEEVFSNVWSAILMTLR